VDAIELGRQRAAALHEAAVKAGHDPWQPYEFALAEAKRRGLDVEPTSPGAAVLNGSRATLIANDDLILHETVGTAFEQAFLVVHEIAHAELGDPPLTSRYYARSISAGISSQSRVRFRSRRLWRPERHGARLRAGAPAILFLPAIPRVVLLVFWYRQQLTKKITLHSNGYGSGRVSARAPDGHPPSFANVHFHQ
jgi:hypothetical protein